MPKIVDHDERRLELVDATWRIIAEVGIEGATMRQIALEAGFSNGALKPYFESKDTLLTFAFTHVLNKTNERIEQAVAGRNGLVALRAFCLEVLPLDQERIREARIVIPFWQRAASDTDKRDLYRESLQQWHGVLRGFLADARVAGQVNARVDDEILASQILNMLLGAQVTIVLGDVPDFTRVQRQLDDFLLLITATPT